MPTALEDLDFAADESISLGFGGLQSVNDRSKTAISLVCFKLQSQQDYLRITGLKLSPGTNSYIGRIGSAAKRPHIAAYTCFGNIPLR